MSPTSGNKQRLNTKLLRLALIACAIVAITSSARAQNVQFTQGDIGSGLENTLQISLGAYPGRGVSLPINLYYSSNVMRIGYMKSANATSGRSAVTEAIFAEHSTAGWKSSLDIPIIEWPKPDDVYWYTGKPYHNQNVWPNTFRVARLYVHMPDGSTHELRKSDQPFHDSAPVDTVGTFYAVDGSRLRYDSTNATTGTLYLPDGSRFLLNEGDAQFIDRNGNTLSYDGSSRQWTDTLGRVIGIPLPAAPSPGDYAYALPGLGGGSMTYVFKWRLLSTVLTSGTVRNLSSHYLPNPNAPPTNQSGDNFPQPASGDSLFYSDYVDDNPSSYTYIVGRGQRAGVPFDPPVLAEIVLPNGLSYKFSYTIYGEIDKITYPTGGFTACEYGPVPKLGATYDIIYSQADRGVIRRHVSANGLGNDLVTWEYSSTGTIITTKSPAGIETEVYRHNFSLPGPSWFPPFGFEDARKGMTHDERVYARNADGSRGAMLRRKLTNWIQTTNTVPPRPDASSQNNNSVSAYRNARPDKEVSIMLDTGGNPLAKTITHQYDATYEFSTGIDRISTTETYFASVVDQATAQTGAISSISSGAVASTAETIYLDSADYRDRNILGLPTSVVLKDSNGQIVTQTESFYDEPAYPLLNYADLTGPDYIDPGTNARANVTTVRRYTDIGANLYLETHAQFDQCGNIVNSWNERGIQSQAEYSSVYKHAYLTRTTSAVPDPSGGHGSPAPFVTSSSFDLATGLVLTTTDVNGQTTQFSYVDDQGTPDRLNRLRKVTRPDGGWTKYSFGETLGNLFTLTETQQDATRTVMSYQYVDPMGRASRSFAFEGGDSYIASDTIYDSVGRVWKVSNPYRTTIRDGVASLAHTSDWTVSHYDALSRVDYVTLPDASVVQTTYEGIYTTVTDQAGKQRRQKTDALGRIVRVDEPDLSGNLGTVDAPTQPSFYQYNTQGNLIAISQGLTQAGLDPEDSASYLQHRYFKFDALGRLTYERQVEQAGTFTTSDPLTGNSAWSRKLVYDETIGGVTFLGLLTSAYDARTIRTEFRYDNLNRIYQVSYSDGTPTVRNKYDQPRTSFFNLGRLTEANTDATANVPSTSQVYDFDLMGRVARQQQVVGTNSYTLMYGYNLGGALTTQTYPSGRVVSYQFDAAARLSAVSSGTTVYANGFDYSTTQGLLKSVALGNGAMERFEYNSRLQIKTIALTKTSDVLQKYEYKYGVVQPDGSVDETKNNGQIGRIESWIGAAKQWQQRFSYDSLGRLSSASELRGDNAQPVWAVNYDFDVFGNRYQKQSRNPGNPFTQIWTEDADLNQSTNRFNSGVTYDDAGNVTIDSKFRNLAFQYDANNRQKQSSAVDGSGAVVSVYDAGGQRVATQVGGALTNVLVYDASGKLVAEYGSAPPEATGTQFVTVDHQGSPRAITNSSGAVVSRHDYAPFGEDLPANIGLRTPGQGYSQTDAVRQKYAGMENDDTTGMSHTLWRQYDNLSARWTAPDPYGGSMTIAAPQSFNRYSYVENDPVNETDPLGLMSGRDASQSWGDVAGLFWGSSFDFGTPTRQDHIGQAMARRDSIMETGYDPAFDVYRGDVEVQYIPEPDGFMVSTTLHNPTPDQILDATESLSGVHDDVAQRGGGRRGGGRRSNPKSDPRNWMERRDSRGRIIYEYVGPGSWRAGIGYPRRAASPVGYSSNYPRDYQTKNTKQYSAQFRTFGEAWSEASRKMGGGPTVFIEQGKVRTQNGRWQMRFKPVDLSRGHIHLEYLNPSTGEVLHNYHFQYGPR